ncbi:hypothetical protein [Streptomyces sp. NPDC087300]|uniref:hypothetical protein n=1 Tax=Streptomyces sp. NPDC087300 TaxID=3365780 RepID=UPI00381D436F
MSAGPYMNTPLLLGPLELTDGRCGVGDSRRPGGSWVEFRPEGLYRHAPARKPSEADELIPWPRIMLGISVYVGRGYPSKGGNFTIPGLLGGLPGLRGRGGGHLDMTLRHPYEDHSLGYDRHPHAYPVMDVAFLEQLLTRTVAAGEAHRLGDAAWLERVVGRLTPVRTWSARGMRDAVAEALRSEGVGSPPNTAGSS